MPWWTRPYSIAALVLFGLLLLPAVILYGLVRLLAPYPEQISWVYRINRCIMFIWSPLTGFRFTAHHTEFVSAGQPYIVIMNHQNIIDMFAAARLLKVPGKPLVKRELLNIPILGWLFAMAALAVKRDDRTSRNTSYDAMAAELSKGISLLIFPEGTRNETDQPLIPFRDGAFRLALDTGIRILPVVVTNAREMSLPKSAWFRPGKIGLHYIRPVDPNDFRSSEDPAAALRAHCYALMEAEILKNDPFFKTK